MMTFERQWLVATQAERLGLPFPQANGHEPTVVVVILRWRAKKIIDRRD